MGNVIKNINLFESLYIKPMDSLYFKKYNALIMEFVKEVDVARYDRMANALKQIFNFDFSFDTNIRGYRTNCRGGERFVYMITKYRDHFSYGWDRLLDFKSEHYFNKDLVYPKLFTIDEVDSYEKIFSILSRGEAAPNYLPKRIERTLEGNGYHPYRFKTKEEMIREYGDFWRSHIENTYFDDGMDYLLGTVLEYPFPDDADEITIPRRDDDDVWWIDRSFITKNEPEKPNYNPKRIERTLESVGNYLPLSVYCDNRDTTLDFEKLLHEWGWQYLHHMKYIIRDQFPAISATTYFDFNNSKKENNIADGRKKTINPQYEYPKDLGKIMRCFGKSPSYNPRKVGRTLESLTDRIVEGFDQDRYDRYKTELNKGNIWIYVKTNNINQTRNFYDMIKRSDKVNKSNLQPKIDSWCTNPTEGQVFCFGFKQDSYNKDKLDVMTIETDSDVMRAYPMWVMDISDHDIIKRLFGIEMAPTYNPRKIDRTLESLNNEYRYRFKTEKEFEKEFGPNWREKPGLWWAPDNHMDYLLGTDLEVDFPNDASEVSIPNRNPHILADHWDIQRKMLVRYTKVPNYRPRKSVRTLERVQTSKYHIKTEQEFIKDFGNDWRNIVALGWVQPMDRFHGRDINIDIDEEEKVKGSYGVIVRLGGYNFSWDMITDSKIPNYNPKKINRTLESFNRNQTTYYNTHGHYAPFSEIKELEEDERENYPEGTFDKWKKKYNISDDDMAIWVTKNKRDVYHYLTTAENWDKMLTMTDDEIKEFIKQNDGIDVDDEMLEVNDDGFIIEESDDGDGGFLFVRKL